MKIHLLSLMLASAALATTSVSLVAAAEAQPRVKPPAKTTGSTATPVRPARSVYVNSTPPGRVAANTATASQRANAGQTARPQPITTGPLAGVLQRGTQAQMTRRAGNTTIQMKSQQTNTNNVPPPPPRELERQAGESSNGARSNQ